MNKHQQVTRALRDKDLPGGSHPHPRYISDMHGLTRSSSAESICNGRFAHDNSHSLYLIEWSLNEHAQMPRGEERGGVSHEREPKTERGCNRLPGWDRDERVRRYRTGYHERGRERFGGKLLYLLLMC